MRILNTESFRRLSLPDLSLLGVNFGILKEYFYKATVKQSTLGRARNWSEKRWGTGENSLLHLQSQSHMEKKYRGGGKCKKI